MPRLAYGAIRAYQFQVAQVGLISSVSHNVWIVKTARFLDELKAAGQTIPEAVKQLPKNSDLDMRHHFNIYVNHSKIGDGTKEVIPSVRSNFKFWFGGDVEQEKKDKNHLWEGIVTELPEEYSGSCEFVVFTKKPKGTQYLPSSRTLEEAQVKGPKAAKMIPDVNKMTLTRQLRAAVTVLRDNARPDLAQLRRILLGRDFSHNLALIDSTQGPLFDALWEDHGDSEQRLHAFQILRQRLLVISSVCTL
ncbi:MAG: hypothetical protein M1830_002852 [Pleopsidium flavum]|nr:MAG: hypothetical protein M1830_002852 [Pleopsidium flavum]